MRTSNDIQSEYQNRKTGKGRSLDPNTDKAYQEAIRRAKLEEAAQDQRNFEALVEDIMLRPQT